MLNNILIFLRLTKICTMAQPNSPDMSSKRTKNVRLGINSMVDVSLDNLKIYSLCNSVVGVVFGIRTLPRCATNADWNKLMSCSHTTLFVPLK